MYSLVLLVGGALLLLVAAALWAAMAQARDSSRWVVHTYSVLQAIEGLESASAELEAAQRAVLVSDRPRFAQERAQAIASLQQGLRFVRELSSDNGSQQSRFEALARLVEARVRIAQESEAKARADPAVARAVIESDDARQSAAAIQRSIASIRTQEKQLLQQRQVEARDFQRSMLELLAAAVTAAVLLIVLAYWGWRRQSALREQVQGRLRDLVQALPVSLWQLRRHPVRGWRFEFISDNAGQLRGIDVAATMRNRELVLEGLEPGERERVEQSLAQSAETLQPLDMHFRVRMPEGGSRWIHSAARVRRDGDGSILWTGYWADVTRERELNRALEDATERAHQATAAKSAFLAAMSHEIRTPMHGVLGLLELLGLSRLEDDQRATLTVVRDSAGALLRIVDDILDFSKIEAGKMDLHPAPASLQELLRNVCQVHSGMASGKGLLLVDRIDPRLAPRHVFDAQRVGQILHNLVSNALKFTREGRITLEARLLAHAEGRERVELIVADTGSGISEENMARIFKPFVQVGAEASGRLGGTGLGLVICQQLARLMGGQLEMHSVFGRGTEVRVQVDLPLAQAGQAGAAAGPNAPLPAQAPPALARRLPPTEAQAEAEGTLVLIADDHPTNRMVLKRQVNSLGYAARSVADGRQALEAWRSGRYRLLIADCNMPELSGYELARAIRAEEAERGLARTPILACTANALVAQSNEWQEAGMDGYLVKPMPLQELARELAQRLPKPQDAREAVLDHELLDAIASGSAQVRAEILSDFQRTNESDAEQLRGAVTAGDAARVVQFAHRIKGACMVVGALPMAEACRGLDEAGRAGDAQAIAHAMSAFEREFDRLVRALDAPGLLSAGAM